MDKEKREVRDTSGIIEFRAAPEGSSSPGTLVGYSAVFEKYSADLGYFREKIAPGAFAKALKSCDIRALLNHEPDNLLGRMSAGTLRLTEDEIGLRAEIDLPNTTCGKDCAESIRLRNIQGQSFSFTVAVDQWDWSGEVALRTIMEFDQVFDVGPVAFPAYEETSIAVRSFTSAKELRNQSSTPPPISPHIIENEHIGVRLRLLELLF